MELESLADNEVITVQTLKKMIKKSFDRASKDEDMLDECMNDIGHDM
jgi:hypothetical protein